MKTIHVVGAVIYNEHGEILCALRSPTMSQPNCWEFPGGKVEDGEALPAALQREIMEELGCAIEVFEKIVSIKHQYESYIVHLHTFWARIVTGYPHTAEHAELRWVPRDELVTLNWAPADIPTVERIL